MAVKRISDFNIAQRGVLSGIYGNTRNSELFLDKDLCACNISKALYLYLKEENYRVVFYDPLKNKGFWSYSEQDLANFFCLNPVIGQTTQVNTQRQSVSGNSQSGLIDNDKYVREGDFTSYKPKINTPFGRLKPRFGPRNQAANRSQTPSNANSQRINANPNSVIQNSNNGEVVCHYPGINFHNDGNNSYFKLQSSPSGFHNVFDNVDERYHTPVVLVYENPENIKPQNPEEIENQYANFIKTYAEKKLKLKIVVVFGSENNRQLAYDFARERGGANSIFFRRSFALRFGLSPSTQNSDDDHENKTNFEKNMFRIGLPEKDEIANLLIRKRICEGLQGTLSPKSFDTLVHSIMLGNYKVPDGKGNMMHPNDIQRLMYVLMDSNQTDLHGIIETVDSGDTEKLLKKRIGAKKVVTQIERLLRMMVKERQIKETTGKEPSSPTRPHMAFIGNPGTGKTTLARLVAQWFREKNVLSKGQFIEAKASDLIDNVVGGTRMKTAAKCEEAMGGILFIDEAYGLRIKEGINYEAEAQEVLLQYMEKPDFCLIIAGYKNEIDSLLAPPNNQGLHDRFVRSNIINFDDYTPQELFGILNQKIDLETTPAFQKTMENVLKKLYRRRDENWANARSVENIWQEIRSLYYEKESDVNSIIDVRHIPQLYLDLIDDKKGDDAEQQLRNRIGMEHVANQVSDLMNIILAEQRLEERTGKKSASPVRPHMVFLGNPGTGKTTAAKLIGRWFRDKSVLTKGHFVESKASDLIDNVVGGTRMKTAAKCEEAMGGILFIDEAYGLCVKKDNLGQISYEAEAQEILLQYMEKPDFLLILAGYTEQINELMRDPNNSGLRGRFTNDSFIQFRDYEPQELLNILLQKIEFGTTAAFRDSMRAVFEVCYRRRTRKWANARSVENIWQEIRGLFYKSGSTEVDVCHIPQNYLKMIDTKPKPKDVVLGELNKMIGIGTIAEQISDIYESVLDDNSLRAAGEPTTDSTYFFIFQGPPGTGKTTVARMLGKILFDMGVLASPDVDEVSKADFTSKYINASENNLSELFDKNLGGTLFIDEAYMLDKQQADVINQKLTSTRYMGKMAVILAGYKDDMDMWLSHNPGLRGRNWTYVDFRSYTNEELWKILLQLMESKHRVFQSVEQCHQLALAWFGLLPRTKEFANARESRRLFDILQKNKTKRLSNRGNSDVRERLVIIPEDFPSTAHEALTLITGLEKRNNPEKSDSVDNIDNGQRKISIDLTKESEEHRATCVEHLEYSVGLLKCSCGSSDDTAQGTAFIISLHNHYLLTCSHVVERKTQFVFSISELKFETPARLLWNNSQCDMALLQVGMLPQEARYMELYIGEQPVAKTTEILLAGYPLGEQVSQNLSVNTGKITNYEAGKQNNDRRFDTYMSDINATHGNSGGPIVRQSDYQVIGLLQGGFEQVQVRLITDIRQLYNNIDIKQ